MLKYAHMVYNKDEKYYILEVWATPTFGRKPIYTKHESVDEGNVIDVLKSAIPKFAVIRQEIKHLYDVYRGNQEILNREKTVRPEINNRCVVNHANEIVSFKVSYLLSEPIMYVNRGTRDVNDGINQLNEYMHLESKPVKDKQIADDFNICGRAYRMVLPRKNPDEEDAAPFIIYTLDPADTFVVRYSGLGHEIVCSVYLIKETDTFGIEHEIACVYTDSMYFEVDIAGAGIQDMTIRKKEPHALGRVPVFEYVNNESQLGSFEIVETVLDAINKLASNRLDGTEQTVQSLMVFNNCEVDSDDISRITQMGAVNVKSPPGVTAGIEMLSPELNQQDQQVQMDDLYRKVLSITGMPAQSNENTSDSSNNGAAFMRGGWYSADARAKDSEALWKKAETEFLKLTLKICRDFNKLDLMASDVDMKFTRRNYEDIQNKSQALLNMLSAGVNPLYALTQCGLFSNPSEVYTASMKYMEKWLMDAQSMEHEPDPESDSDDGAKSDRKDVSA